MRSSSQLFTEFFGNEGELAHCLPEHGCTHSSGGKKTLVHLRRERAFGLSQAKKAQFKREKRKLFCERCNMDPIDTYGEELGEACIEVHHLKTHVRNMKDDHVTRLKDLQCLCANCHRIVHRELKISEPSTDVF